MNNKRDYDPSYFDSNNSNSNDSCKFRFDSKNLF